MAILRSLDGRFFEVPDDQVERYLIPEDQVKSKLDAAGAPQVPPPGPPSGGPGPGPGAPPPMIVVQIYGPPTGGGAPPPLEVEQPAAGAEVQPYAFWNNFWHNRTGNWNNFWHNMHR